MSVAEILDYDKDGEPVKNPRFRRIFLVATIILTALLAFGIGRLSAPNPSRGVTVELDQELQAGTANEPLDRGQTAAAVNAIKTSGAGEIVASKSGSKYHYPHCSGAKQIKEENKIFFASPQAAEAAGYTLAANCKPR